MNEIDARSLQEKLKETSPPLILDVRNPRSWLPRDASRAA